VAGASWRPRLRDPARRGRKLEASPPVQDVRLYGILSDLLAGIILAPDLYAVKVAADVARIALVEPVLGLIV
jgi:hypothetical protein